MFSTTNTRALSAMSSPLRAGRAPKTRFQSAGPGLQEDRRLGLIDGAGRARKRAELLDLDDESFA
jgi:hypothetical protein